MIVRLGQFIGGGRSVSDCRLVSAVVCILTGVIATFPAVATATVTEAYLDPGTVRISVTEASDVRFMRLARSQGLSQQRVTHIVQDDQGFMWFGTQYGLNRYDGYRFRVFTYDPEDPRSLCGVFIYSLFKDQSGALWVGCDYSLDRYDAETESFIHYRIDPDLPLTPKSRVNHISQDDAGYLWLSTGNGLYRLHPDTAEVMQFEHRDDDSTSLGSNDVVFSGQDSRGNFWVATRLGLEMFDRASGRVRLRLPIQEPRELAFYEDREGVFWLYFASGNGLAVYDAGAQTLTPYSFRPSDATGRPLTGVSSMIEDENGALWIGTHSDGLLRFDRERRRFVRYRYDPSDNFSLPENRVTTLAEDKEGNIWVGLGGTEPALFAPPPQPFTTLPFDSDNTDNLGERLVNSIHQDADGVLWVGTTGALNRIDRGIGTTQRFEFPGEGIASDVLSLLRDPSGKLWVGTSGQGLYWLDETTGTATGYRHEQGNPDSLSNDGVLDLWADGVNELWVATFDGLNRLDLATGRSAMFKHFPSGRPAIYSSIAKDSSGRFWLGGYGFGLLRFDPGTGSFDAFGHSDQAGNGLSDNRINSIFVDHEDAIWAATQNGLNRFDPATGLMETYFEKDGLASNAASCVLEDSTGAIWIGTSNGLSRLDRKSGSFKNYSQVDGLPGPDLTGWSACFRGPQGEMFFGGFSGAVAFMPDGISERDFVPPIVLTGFQLFGAKVIPGRGSPLERSIGYTSSVKMSHQENTVLFEFAALSFLSPDTNRYRYMLEGLDTDWQQGGSDRRFARYTNLSPGSYRFRVQGATSRGPWSEPGSTLHLAILPPWWGRWWFRIAVVIFLAAMSWTAYSYRVRRIAHQFEIQLEARVSERMRIARELHDSLLQGFQGMMFSLQAVRNMLPGRADEAAGVLEGAMNRGDQAIAEGREAVWSLRASNTVGTDLTEAVAALGAELESVTNQPLPAYRVIVEGQPKLLLPMVCDEVYRIAREAFRNAVVHAQADNIVAEIDYGDTMLSVRVRDDGIGIDPDILGAGRRTGHWGIPGMRERVEDLKGRCAVRSERGTGTEIELQIPAAVAYGKQQRFR